MIQILTSFCWVTIFELFYKNLQSLLVNFLIRTFSKPHLIASYFDSTAKILIIHTTFLKKFITWVIILHYVSFFPLFIFIFIFPFFPFSAVPTEERQFLSWYVIVLQKLLSQFWWKKREFFFKYFKIWLKKVLKRPFTKIFQAFHT